MKQDSSISLKKKNGFTWHTKSISSTESHLKSIVEKEEAKNVHAPYQIHILMESLTQ